MTGTRDGAGGPPDLLASLPEERAACGIDPAAIDEILACVRELREERAGLTQAVSAERGSRPENVKVLEKWLEGLAARYAETARAAVAPDAAATADRIRRIEEAAAKAAAAADRVDGEVKGAKARIALMHATAAGMAAAADRIATRAPGWRFGVGTLVTLLIVSAVPFAMGMLFESRALLLHRWLWAG